MDNIKEEWLPCFSQVVVFSLFGLFYTLDSGFTVTPFRTRKTMTPRQLVRNMVTTTPFCLVQDAYEGPLAQNVELCSDYGSSHSTLIMIPTWSSTLFPSSWSRVECDEPKSEHNSTNSL